MSICEDLEIRFITGYSLHFDPLFKRSLITWINFDSVPKKYLINCDIWCLHMIDEKCYYERNQRIAEYPICKGKNWNYSWKQLSDWIFDFKKVDFKLTGDQGSLPKDKMSLLEEAMVHIIRNSLDHGIENTQERIEKGLFMLKLSRSHQSWTKCF